ncbi:glycosyltransferase [Bowmanella denitrificans]|uniref:glycosyltransferase n=1 Tax=Bowmanella denitrificans TaxID=366582 RepID=UPI000C9C615C|nr:glycosyltransferase [Bowmanella denitrificans]
MNISVVIPTYNRQTLLQHTLESLCRQTLDKEAFEVIVVDDGGTDQSAALCQSFEHRLNIRYFWQTDAGFRPAKARNVGIVAAEGEVILMLDSGIILSQQGLARHVQRHQSAELNKVVIGYVYGFKADQQALTTVIESVSSEDVDASVQVMQQAGLFDSRQWQYDELGKNLAMWPAPFDIFWTAHVSAKRSELIRAGLFDESFTSWGGEDVDLGIRLFHNNNKYELADDICAIHWPHFEQSGSSETENEAAINAVIKINQKYQSWQTSYYMKTLGEPLYSLNKVVRVLGK